MNIPLHVKIRKHLRNKLYELLHLFKKKQPDTLHYIDKKEIKHIVIIRPNYRIGNLIFLTPLINELQKELPEAKIDLIVGIQLAGNILQEMPNVENIYAISRNLLKKPWQLYSFIHNIRKKRYDLALNITAGSVSSELATLLVHAKYKASFKHEKTFIPLTHTVNYEAKYLHAGSRPLELLKLFNIPLPDQALPLDIKLTQEELKIGKEALYETLKNTKDYSFVIVFFRNARFDKKLDDTWWQQYYETLKKIDNKLVVIDILSPDIPQKLNNEVLEYSNKNLRILGAFFQACNLYVSADTGPLHLACASKAKVVALFNKTNPDIYGTLGKENLTLDIESYSQEEIASITYKQLRKIK